MEKEILRRLSEAIKYNHLSQCEIAKGIGVSQQIISEYVHMRKMPSLDTFAKLCKVLEVDSNIILGLDK